MPNKRIDQLTPNNQPIDGSELIPLYNVNNNSTRRAPINDVATFISNNTDTYVTGATYSNGTLTLSRNDGVNLTASGFSTGTTNMETYLEVTVASGSTSYSDGRPPMVGGILDLVNGQILLDYSTLSTDEYFSDMKFTVEFIPNTTPYTVTSMDYLAISANGGNYMSLIDKNLLTKTSKSFVDVIWNNVYEDGSGQNYYEVQTPSLISEINIISYNGSNPTLGDGTLLVKIWYKVKTFGTEL